MHVTWWMPGMLAATPYSFELAVRFSGCNSY
jgi:hypothetical protein